MAQIVHDLKNPLMAIELEATMLDAWLTAGDQTRGMRAITRIQDNVAFLDRVVHDLLDVCAFAAGQFELSCAPCDLGLLIEHVVERVAGDALDRVCIHAPTQLVARVDDIRIQRVVTNLLDNALRYSPDSTPVLITLVEDAGHATVSVIDTGPGIPASEHSDVFDRYRRGSTALCTGGSGLGLYACKRIVEAHGGWIRVERIRPHGSRFELQLPL